MSRSLDELTREEKKSLYEEMLAKKTGQIDVDWQEIVEAFDLNITSDTLRKAGVGVKLASDAVTNDAGQCSAYDEGYIQRQSLRDTSRQINEIYRSESRSRALRECVEDSVSRLSPIEIADNSYVKHDYTNSELVVGVGDFHFGAKFKITGLMGEVVNEYNADIFKERMTHLLSEIHEIVDDRKIRKVNVFMVGDLIDGMLRQSQLMRLQYGMVDQTMQLSEFLSCWLISLSEFADVEVWACSGNHAEARPLKAKSREFAEENLERVVLWYLKARLKEFENITVHELCERNTFVRIQGYNFLLLHGDGEKNISRIARDIINMYHTRVDYFVCGHLHHETDIPAGNTENGDSVIIRVPSVCGTDNYAQSRGLGASAGATAMVIERDYGRRCVYPIRLK